MWGWGGGGRREVLVMCLRLCPGIKAMVYVSEHIRCVAVRTRFSRIYESPPPPPNLPLTPPPPPHSWMSKSDLILSPLSSTPHNHHYFGEHPLFFYGVDLGTGCGGGGGGWGGPDGGGGGGGGEEGKKRRRFKDHKLLFIVLERKC